MKSPKSATLIFLLGVASFQLSGCVVLGGVLGSVLAEPEMRSDLEPFQPGTKSSIKLRGNWKRRVLFTGVDQMSADEYKVLYERSRLSSSELAIFPQLGDTVVVTCEKIDQSFQGQFNGFVGYGEMRLSIGLPSGAQMECPVDHIIVTRNQDEQQVYGLYYALWAKSGSMPSRTIIIVEGASGVETYQAAEIVSIHRRVRHKRVVRGTLIGFGVDILAVLALRAYCRGECFSGGFD